MRSNTNVNYNPREPVLPGGHRYIMDHDPKQSQFPFENLRPLGYFLTERPELTSIKYQIYFLIKEKNYSNYVNNF